MDSGNSAATGNTAEVFVRDGKIVKIYKSADMETATAEARKQQYVHSPGVPVPELYDLTTVDGRPAIVMEHILGETMLAAIGDDSDVFSEFMQRSVRIQRSLHAIDAPELPSMRTKLESQIRQAALVSDERRARLIAMLDELSAGTSLCHGDFHIQNLIVHGDDVSIIDWMDATAGDPRLDVCRSYVLYGSVSTDAAEMYLHEYCEQTGLSPEEILQWEPVVAAARLSETVNEAEARRLAAIVEAW